MLKKLVLIAIVLLQFSCKEDSVEPIEYGTIEGGIYDSETQLPVEGASISSTPGTSVVASLKDGSYKIKSLPVGNYSIAVKKAGYTKETISISIRANEITTAIVFLDKTTEELVFPLEPKNPTPSNGSTNQPTSLNLSWSAFNQSDNDSLLFDVFVYESNSTVKNEVGSSIKDSSIVLKNLKYATTYYWYVVAKNSAEETTRSETWTFSTLPRPQNPIIMSYLVDGEYDIYSIGKDGESLAEIVSLPGNELWPRYCPNKRYIAYSADNGVGRNIYILNIENNSSYKLTDITVASYNNGGYGFCWSNDGGHIVFGHYEKLYQIDINGSNLELILEAPTNRHFKECDYSPVGNKIVAVTVGSNAFDSEIYLIDKNTKTMELLVDNISGIVEKPSFSIDGKQILYTHDVSGNESLDGRQLNSHIFLMNLATKTIVDLSNYKPSGTNDFNPRFSPDGASVIFNNSPNDNSQQATVWIMDVAGHSRTHLVDNAFYPDWR